MLECILTSKSCVCVCVCVCVCMCVCVFVRVHEIEVSLTSCTLNFWIFKDAFVVQMKII